MKDQQATGIKDKQNIICYHCGDICRGDHVIFDDKDFCCNGCKTVYEILDQKGLCNYYELEKNPGTTIDTKDYGEKFDYLDNTEIQQKILSFRDGKMAKATFYIPSIHCSSCIWLLENLHKLQDGIRYSRVNFTRKELTLDFQEEVISLKKLVAMLASVGYEPYISLEDETRSRILKTNRGLLIRLGVAGFCFGNIMLLSFPSYFGFSGLSDIFLQKFFIWLNVILSLPVVFYCSTTYFSSALAGLRASYINIDVPVSLGIITLFLYSIYEVVLASGTGYFDSLAGLVFFLLIGKWIQGLTYEGLSFDRDYKSYFPLAVMKIDGDNREFVPVRELKKGHIIQVRNNEIIPADSLLLDEKANIDYSFISGESDPIVKNRGDLIYAGGRQMGPAVNLAVEKPVSQSYLTGLWNNETFAKDKNSEFQQIINVISKYFTVFVLTTAVLSFTVWAFIDINHAWFIFIAVLIVACPCALSLASPFTLGNTLKVFGRNRFYVKNTAVIEELSRIDHIVFDKTGTLSENKSGTIEFSGEKLSDAELFLIKSAASGSIHPVNRMILQYGRKSNIEKAEISGYREVTGEGLVATVNGTEVRIGSEKIMKDLNGQEEIPSGHPEFSVVHVAINNRKKGYFRIRSQYREGLAGMISGLGNGYSMSILSGDNESEKERLENIFPPSTTMRFRQSPGEKLEYINQLKSQKHEVLMLGDGLNDAGALMASDVGVAVTDNITLFTPASDAILQGNNLHRLPDFIRFSVIARKVIITGLIISFIYNLVGLGFAVSGHLSPLVAAVLMPASSISVVAFSTFMISLLARINNI